MVGKFNMVGREIDKPTLYKIKNKYFFVIFYFWIYYIGTYLYISVEIQQIIVGKY